MQFVLFETGGLTLLCRGCEGWLEDNRHPVVSGKKETIVVAHLLLPAWSDVAIEQLFFRNQA